jgi:flagellar motor switch protein FliN/FliY
MAELNQEQIDALLNQNIMKSDKDILTKQEIDTVGEIGNISMGNSATALSELLNRKIKITTPIVSIINSNDYINDYPKPFVSVEIQYTKGLQGKNVLNIRQEDVLRITDIMMGGSGENVEGDIGSELHLSAMGELMNQLMGSAATALSSMVEQRIDISPPKPTVINFSEGGSIDTFEQNEKLVRIVFTLSIQGQNDSEIMQLMPIDFAKELTAKLTAKYTSGGKQPVVEAPISPPPREMFVQENVQQPPMQQAMQQQVQVQNVQFQSFAEQENNTQHKDNSYGILMDIPLQVSVELGRVQRNVSDILAFSKGTIIELNKPAGETAEIVINNKVIGRGEIIVIDESYGIRITEVINNKEL